MMSLKRKYSEYENISTIGETHEKIINYISKYFNGVFTIKNISLLTTKFFIEEDYFEIKSIDELYIKVSTSIYYFKDEYFLDIYNLHNYIVKFIEVYNSSFYKLINSLYRDTLDKNIDIGIDSKNNTIFIDINTTNYTLKINYDNKYHVSLLKNGKYWTKGIFNDKAPLIIYSYTELIYEINKYSSILLHDFNELYNIIKHRYNKHIITTTKSYNKDIQTIHIKLSDLIYINLSRLYYTAKISYNINGKISYKNEHIKGIEIFYNNDEVINLLDKLIY